MNETLDMRVETADSTRAKFAAKLGLDQPSALDMVSRSDYASDAEYLDAVVKEQMKLEDPAYQAARRKLAHEYRERQETGEREAQAQEYKRIRSTVQLSQLDEREIDKEARQLAQRDLVAGRIPTSGLADAIADHAARLTEQRLNTLASNQLFNSMLRRSDR